MKKLQYMLFLLPMFISAACTKSDDGPAPIRITFTTDVQTRAAGASVMTNFKNGDAIQIFRSSSTSITDNDLTTYKATYNNSTWSVSPAATIRGKEKFYFYATYPASGNTSNVVDPTAIPVNVNSQIDYLYSGSSVMASQTETTVAFKMHHAMMVVAFNIQSYTGGKLTAIKIGNDKFPLQGEMRITNGAISPTAYGTYTKSFNLPLTTTGWTSDHPSIFAIPHQIGAEGLPVELTVDGRTYPITIPSMQLVRAYKYVFYVRITEQGGAMLQTEKTETINLMDMTQALPDVSYK